MTTSDAASAGALPDSSVSANGWVAKGSSSGIKEPNYSLQGLLGWGAAPLQGTTVGRGATNPFRMPQSAARASSRGLGRNLGLIDLSEIRAIEQEETVNASRYDALQRELRQLVMTNSAIQANLHDQLSAQMQELRAAVAQIAADVGRHREQHDHDAEITPGASLMSTAQASRLSTQGLVELARKNGQLRELFEYVADEGSGGFEGLEAEAIKAFKSSSPMLRAAAGRALARVSPSDAQNLLPAQIKTEHNRMAAALMRGALAAIEA